MGISGEGKILVPGFGLELISCQLRGRVFCFKLMGFKGWGLDVMEIF